MKIGHLITYRVIDRGVLEIIHAPITQGVESFGLIITV